MVGEGGEGGELLDDDAEEEEEEEEKEDVGVVVLVLAVPCECGKMAVAVCKARVRGEVMTSCGCNAWIMALAALACATPCTVRLGSKSASGGSLWDSGWLCTATPCRSKCRTL